MITIKNLSLKTYLLLLLSTLALAGCKKSSDEDESVGTVDKSLITGKWFYVKTVEKDKQSGDVNTEAWTNGEHIILNADGTAFDSMNGDNATWRVSGDQLVIMMTNSSRIAQVQKLTSSQLVLYLEDASSESTVTFKR